MEELFQAIAEECCQHPQPVPPTPPGWRRAAHPAGPPTSAKPPQQQQEQQRKPGGGRSAEQAPGTGHPPVPATPLRAPPALPAGRHSSDSSGSETGRRPGITHSVEWSGTGAGWGGSGWGSGEWRSTHGGDSAAIEALLHRASHYPPPHHPQQQQGHPRQARQDPSGTGSAVWRQQSPGSLSPGEYVLDESAFRGSGGAWPAAAGGAAGPPPAARRPAPEDIDIAKSSCKIS